MWFHSRRADLLDALVDYTVQHEYTGRSISRSIAALGSAALPVSGGGAGRAAKRLRRHVLGVHAIGSPLDA
jgi:hypothetical protein